MCAVRFMKKSSFSAYGSNKLVNTSSLLYFFRPFLGGLLPHFRLCDDSLRIRVSKFSNIRLNINEIRIIFRGIKELTVAYKISCGL